MNNFVIQFVAVYEFNRNNDHRLIDIDECFETLCLFGQSQERQLTNLDQRHEELSYLFTLLDEIYVEVS